jgi:hypothetical protein
MRRMFAIGAIAAVALLSACSGGGSNASPEVASLGTNPAAADDPDSSDAPAASAPTDPQEAMLAYTQCMRENGIEMDDPSGANGDAGIALNIDESNADEFEAAEKECSQLLAAVEGDDADVDPELEAEAREQMLAFAECMREQGFDVPDPVFADDGGGMHIQEAGPGDGDGARPADPEDEDFAAAEEECGMGVDGPVGSMSLDSEDDS